MTQFYRQCELRKGNTVQVSWIPEKFAQKGRPVALRKEIGKGCVRGHTEWDDGWIVEKVGAREPENVVRMMEDAHRRQRGESDI